MKLTGLAVDAGNLPLWYWDANTYYLDESRIDGQIKQAQRCGVSIFEIPGRVPNDEKCGCLIELAGDAERMGLSALGIGRFGKDETL